MFIPRTGTDSVTHVNCEAPAEGVKRGAETIMVVEDNEMVRSLAEAMLQDLGYRVIVAETPDRCLELLNTSKAAIDLLVTDVVMPGMNGKDLIERLRLSEPELKVLFMSGYSRNIITHNGVFNEGVNFIQKPFTMSSLSEKVRQALEAPCQ